MIKKSSLVAFLTFMTALFSGCSDEYFDRKDQEERPDGLQICVPTPVLTRAQSPASGKELTIESLTLFAYPTNSTSKFQVKQLKDIEANTATAVTVKDSYTKFSVPGFPNGSYKFYLVANAFTGKSEDELKASFEDVDDLLAEMVTFNSDLFTFAGSSNKTLPMSAAPSDFWDGSDATKNFADGVEVSGGATLYADMTFGVAKVTVCVEDEAGDNVGMSAATLSAYASQFPVIENTQTVTASSSNIVLSSVSSLESGTGTGNYPSNLKTYTFYVPENTLSKSKMMLSITPAGSDSAVDIELGERDDDGNVTANSVARGFHFDYLVTNKGDITLNVMEWSPEDISTGVVVPFNIEITPNYISELASGDEAEITFRVDDGINVSGVSPKINGKDLFGFRVEDNKLIVYIEGPGLAEYNKLTTDAEKEQYHYFHLKALNLMKRIKIGKLSATPFFTVTPQEITVDMREKVASGIDTETIPITFNTSLPDGVNAVITSIITSDGGVIEYDESKYEEIFYLDHSQHTSGAMKGKDLLTLKGMTSSGNDFWKEEKTVVITYTAYGEGAALIEGGAQRDVVVKIIPYTTTYKIHLKAEKNDGGYWSDPHIYVYQVLEFPADLSYKDGLKLPHAGGSVAEYKDKGTPNAALQYLFTGDIAFKGWKGYGGDANNDPYAAVKKTDNGFWEVTQLNDNGEFNPTNDKRYKLSKFNEAQKAGINVCGSCSSHYSSTSGKEGNTYYNLTWPGIRMTQETDDWFLYELSGMAEPGRTLIMFKEGHANNAENKDRFPGNNRVGVPLFDYQDKEGWFVIKRYKYDDQYDVNYFVDDKPGGPSSTTKNITLYLYSPDWSNPSATIKNGDVTYASTKTSETPLTGMTVYKYTATVPAKDTKLTVTFANGSDKVENITCHTAGIPYDKMVYDMTTGAWYGYDSWKALASVPDNAYRIYVKPDGGTKGGNPWDNNIGMYIYKYVNGVKTTLSEGKWADEGWSYITKDNNRYYYKDFTEDAASFSVEMTMLYPDEIKPDGTRLIPNLSGTITVSNSLFEKEPAEEVKRKCYTITAYTSGRPGKP